MDLRSLDMESVKIRSNTTEAMRIFLGVHRFAPITGPQNDMGWMIYKSKPYINIVRF